ncbi:MAG: carbohydrate-binding domain-containing protein, partial [Clostridia bacterium]|nr:carbohydrate-binding domain-containing protein [Clostridia bacterium]
MKNSKIWALLVALILLAGAVPVSGLAEGTDISSLYKDKDVNADYDSKDVTVIDLSALTEDLVITKKGDYLLSGSLNGQVRVEAGEEDKVRLILNGVTITAQNGSAIYEKLSDKLIVTLAEGSANSLTVGAPITDEDDTIGAALYCEDDLSINGTGSLTAVSAQKHGIQSKADLILAGGSISVTSAGDGIRGRNSVLILDGAIEISAQGDGIATTRDDKDGKGWLLIAGGSISITTGSGAGEMRAPANSQMGRGWGSWNQQTQNKTQSDVSQKGIKAATSLEIQGGSFTLNCADDALHGANVTVSGGDLAIKTGDDALHADEKALISGGSIDIAQCYEGIEGTDVLISGGSISVIASDDAVNAAGGGDQSGMMGGWGM